jgi:hypothetical protein
MYKWICKVSGELHSSTAVALGKESLVHVGGWVVPELSWTLKQGWSEKLLAQRHNTVWVSLNATFHGDFWYHISSPPYVVCGLVYVC